MLTKILNEESDEENNIKSIASLASNDEVDVVPSTYFNFDDLDDVHGDNQNVKGKEDNASNSTGTTP